MATFGQGINAQLGAIDYSAYQRGAAQGAQNIGQGLANLGQELGAGLKKRGEYKAEVTAALKTADLINTTADIPEGVKKLAASAKLQLNDPNISLREQAAIGSRMNGMFGGVLKAGLATAMEDPTVKKTRETTLEAGILALKRQKKNTAAFEKAVSLNTDTEGNVTVGSGLGEAYVAAGGDDLSLLEPLKQFGFKPSVTTIPGDDGEGDIKIINTGVNSAVQARPNPLPRITNMAERERLTVKLQRAVQTDDWETATSLAAALNIQGMFGAAGKNDLIRMYGKNASSPTDGSGQGGGLDTSASQKVPKLTSTPATPAQSAEQEINDAKAWLARNPGANPGKIEFIKNKYGL